MNCTSSVGIMFLVWRYTANTHPPPRHQSSKGLGNKLLQDLPNVDELARLQAGQKLTKGAVQVAVGVSMGATDNAPKQVEIVECSPSNKYIYICDLNGGLAFV